MDKPVIMMHPDDPLLKEVPDGTLVLLRRNIVPMSEPVAAPPAASEPVCWMQSNHLNQLAKRRTGSSMMLARCSDHKAMDDFAPLYTAPPTQLIEAARQALEAMQVGPWTEDSRVRFNDAITALRRELEKCK